MKDKQGKQDKQDKQGFKGTCSLGLLIEDVIRDIHQTN